jgi:hypothetical protein
MLLAQFALAASIARCDAHPAYRIVAHATATTLAGSAAPYRATARITFAIPAPDSRPAFPANDPGLRDHIRGHLRIAQRLVATAGATTTGFGKSPAAARAALRSDIAALTRETQQELTRRERSYDRVTDGGREQDQGPLYGFPGGADATTVCVRPRSAKTANGIPSAHSVTSVSSVGSAALVASGK